MGTIIEQLKPLTEPVSSLPHFMPNQVLTQKQLNDVVYYLEQQERLTRQRLIGIGIVCGLQVNLSSSSNTVNISPGVGITSCGFLINFPGGEYTKYKKFTPKNYEPFNSIPTNSIPHDRCIELFLKSNSSEEATIPLDPGATTDKVVVLFLDIIDKPAGKCLGENCDEKGNNWIFNLRPLLIDKTDVDTIIKAEYNLSQSIILDDYFNPEYHLPTAFIKRFGYTVTSGGDEKIDLSGIVSFDIGNQSFVNLYKDVIETGSLSVANGIYKAYDSFKDLFNLQLGTSSNPFIDYDKSTATDNALALKLTGPVGFLTTSPKSCQYLYDFVRDLIDTYHELRDELFKYVSECCPTPNLFPRHLMLGELNSTTVFGKFVPEDYPPSYYRNNFISSPVMNNQSEILKRIKFLIQRLYLQCNQLDFSGILKVSDIRVIPDKPSSFPLGERRIPFYYKVDGTPLIYNYWDFEKTIQNRANENRSYFFYNNSAFPPGKLPVVFDFCKYPKLSIEGHVGKKLNDAINSLKSLREKYNLSFDILTLKLDQPIDSSNIIQIEDESLISDLQEMYLKERNELFIRIQEFQSYCNTASPNNKNALAIADALAFITNEFNNVLPNSSDIIYQTLICLNSALTAMLAVLDTKIVKLNIDCFCEVFIQITSYMSFFNYCIDSWGERDLTISSQKGVIAKIFLKVKSFLFDEITAESVLAKFISINSMYQERIKNYGFFSEFNMRIRGMEHIAGTKYGGTFILIYGGGGNKVADDPASVKVMRSIITKTVNDLLKSSFPDIKDAFSFIKKTNVIVNNRKFITTDILTNEVVADFYLPYSIKNYRIADDPADAIIKINEFKTSLAWNAITEAISCGQKFTSRMINLSQEE